MKILQGSLGWIKDVYRVAMKVLSGFTSTLRKFRGFRPE